MSSYHDDEQPLSPPTVGTIFILFIPFGMTILDRGKPEGDGWHWRTGDFIVMGMLRFGAVYLYEFLAGKIRTKAYRIG